MANGGGGSGGGGSLDVVLGVCMVAATAGGPNLRAEANGCLSSGGGGIDGSGGRAGDGDVAEAVSSSVRYGDGDSGMCGADATDDGTATTDERTSLGMVDAHAVDVGAGWAGSGDWLGGALQPGVRLAGGSAPAGRTRSRSGLGRGRCCCRGDATHRRHVYVGEVDDPEDGMDEGEGGGGGGLGGGGE